MIGKFDKHHLGYLDFGFAAGVLDYEDTMDYVTNCSPPSFKNKCAGLICQRANTQADILKFCRQGPVFFCM